MQISKIQFFAFMGLHTPNKINNELTLPKPICEYCQNQECDNYISKSPITLKDECKTIRGCEHIHFPFLDDKIEKHQLDIELDKNGRPYSVVLERKGKTLPFTYEDLRTYISGQTTKLGQKKVQIIEMVLNKLGDKVGETTPMQTLRVLGLTKNS